jgi:integrase
VVKKVHVRVNEAGTLYFDFHLRGVRCKEYTRLTDTPVSRKRCEKMAQIIANEIDLGMFDYLRHFPHGSRRHLFTGRPDGNIAFARFVEESWLAHIRTKVRGTTAEEYKAILRVRVLPLIGSIPLREFRPEHMDRLINHLRSLKGVGNRPLSPRRINIILLRVRSVLDLAYERGYLEKNPHTWVTLQEEKRPHVDPFSFEEREALLAALPEPEKGFRKACANFWKNYFIVAFDTGLRPSEQLALRWAPDPKEPERTSYVDLERQKIFIRQGLVRGAETALKTQRSYRVMDMLPTVEDVLRDQLAGTQGKGTYVFSNAWGGPLDLTNIRHRIWYPTLARAGLRLRDLYQTRHTFASLMLQSGEDPAWIALMMGHTTTKMLYERYAAFIRHRTRQDGAAYLEQVRRSREEASRENRP